MVTTASISPSAESSCEMELIAKDGVYLNSAPRLVRSLHLSPGSRCDVLVRCNEVISAVTWTAATTMAPPIPPGIAQFQSFPILTLNIVRTASSSKSSMNLTSFQVMTWPYSALINFLNWLPQVNRPCYLATTLHAESNTISTKTSISLNIGGSSINGEGPKS